MAVGKLGWIRDLPDFRDLPYSEAPKHLLGLAPSHTLKPLCPPIVDQGQMNSCVANAMAFQLEFIQKKGLLDHTKQPEVFKSVFDPISRLFIYYNCRAIDGDVNQDQGTQIRSGVLAVVRQGICEETLWPYVQQNLYPKPSTASYSQASSHKIKAGYKIDHTSLMDQKICLSNGYPYLIGISVYSSFENVGSDGIIPMPKASEQLLGGHCLCVVGYDDSTRRFTIANSWGSSWGDKGYCYIPYSYLINPGLASDFWTVREQ